MRNFLRKFQLYFGEETNISLRQAMIDGRDDIIQNDFDYSWEEDEYYHAPLKVEGK